MAVDWIPPAARRCACRAPIPHRRVMMVCRYGFRSTSCHGHDHGNQRWVADTSEFLIGSSGKLYLATVLDLYSRFVVGWAVSAINDWHPVIWALRMAPRRRRRPVGLRHHSDRGSPYASENYQAVLHRARHDGEHKPAWRLP